jgi:hypothetical protein
LSSQPTATEDTRARAAAEAAAALRARQTAMPQPAKMKKSPAEILRSQLARKAEQQREQLRRAGLTVKAQEVGRRGDESNRPANDSSRDDGREL